MRINAFIVIVLLMRPAVVSAQEANAAPKPLVARSSHALGVPPFTFTSAQCDGTGTPYFLMGGATGPFQDSYIMALDMATENPTIYKLPEAYSGTEMGFFNFFVSPSKNVWILHEGREGYSIFHFTYDGSLKGQVHLNIPDNLELPEFAVSEESQIVFVGGHFTEQAEGTLRGKSFVALLDHSGNIVRQISEASGKPIDMTRLKNRLPERAVTAGPHGNFYALQADEVLVISPSGKVIQRFPFSNPDSGNDIESIRSAGNLLSIHFLKNSGKDLPRSRFLIVDSETGKGLINAEDTHDTGNNPVCFSSVGYTFFRIINGKVTLVFAEMPSN